MYEDKIAPDTTEITSLNVESLDVEELERRLEMATGEMTTAAWICGTNENTCNPVCTTNSIVASPVDTEGAE